MKLNEIKFCDKSTLEFLSFYVTWHLHEGWESCQVGWKSVLFGGNFSI